MFIPSVYYVNAEIYGACIFASPGLRFRGLPGAGMDEHGRGGAAEGGVE